MTNQKSYDMVIVITAIPVPFCYKRTHILISHDAGARETADGRGYSRNKQLDSDYKLCQIFFLLCTLSVFCWWRTFPNSRSVNPRHRHRWLTANWAGEMHVMSRFPLKAHAMKISLCHQMTYVAYLFICVQHCIITTWSCNRCFKQLKPHIAVCPISLSIVTTVGTRPMSAIDKWRTSVRE